MVELVGRVDLRPVGRPVREKSRENSPFIKSSEKRETEYVRYTFCTACVSCVSDDLASP